MSAARNNTPLPPLPLTPEQIIAYLEYAMTDLGKRRDVVVAALKATAGAYPTIDSDQVLGEVADNVRMASALERAADDTRKTEKKPFLDGGRTVDSWFKDWLAPLTDAIDPCQQAMTDYGSRKLAERMEKAREEARIAEEKAKRDAEVAAKALDEGKAGAQLDQAMRSAQAAQQAVEQAEARPSAFTHTRGQFGASAALRVTWGWEVEDFDLIPREYLTVDPDAMRAAGVRRDKSGKPTAVIPGIRWVGRAKMGVR